MDQRRKNKKRKNGFTIIEFLIYSAIVSFVIGALTFTGINVLYGRIKVISMEEVNNNANFSLGKITYLIRNSESVSIASGSSLTLNTSSPADDPTVIFLENEAIMISKGVSDSRRLTTELVKVNTLSFQELLSDTVTIEAVFEFYNPSGKQEYKLIRTFRTTENVRK